MGYSGYIRQMAYSRVLCNINMKIKSVKISKFRSIENGVFECRDLHAVIGQNNAGKSSVLRALNSFFNPDDEIDSFKDGTNLYTNLRSVPRITIEFSSVPNTAIY